MEVALPFFDLSGLSLLVCVDEPLKVVFFEFAHIRVILLLGDLDALIPPVQLLVHGHGLFDLVILQQNSLSPVELLV